MMKSIEFKCSFLAARFGKTPFWLHVCWLFLVAALLIGGTTLHAASAPKASPAEQKDVNPANYVGSETCATCHEDVVKGFEKNNPHNKLVLQHGKAGTTCEGCHGAGKAHVDGGGDKTKIFVFTSASAKAVDERCLNCHQGKHANFERSAHGEANVSCVSCHSVHKSASEEHLLKTSNQTQLCYQCHTDIKSQFNLPFHHKVNEGLISCSDCHDPHGSANKKGLKNAASTDQVCVKCHTEKAGPFVFEHMPVKTEGCTACHSVHGSPNPRLLVTANVNSLCLQCHTINGTTPNGSFPTTPQPVGPQHNQTAQYQACTVFHTQIHGSNAAVNFFK
jgi:DmsE family decaheme c-type cytochrome